MEGIVEYDFDPKIDALLTIDCDLSILLSFMSFRDEMADVFDVAVNCSKTLLLDFDEVKGSGLALKLLSIFFLDKPGDKFLVSRTVVELFAI